MIWSRDGQFLLFNSTQGDRSEIHRIRADGTGETESLYVSSATFTPYPVSEGPNGELLFCSGTADAQGEIFVLAEPGADPMPFASSLAVEEYATFSPDGRWIAYVSNVSGDWEVYARPYPPGPGITKLSDEPGWRLNGAEVSRSSSTTTQSSRRSSSVLLTTILHSTGFPLSPSACGSIGLNGSFSPKQISPAKLPSLSVSTATHLSS